MINTSRAGVILAGQNGAGATNLVSGLGQAAAAFSLVVSIAGSLSTGHVYCDAFQEVDQQSLFLPVTKKASTVPHADRVPEMFREAFRMAMSGFAEKQSVRSARITSYVPVDTGSDIPYQAIRRYRSLK